MKKFILALIILLSLISPVLALQKDIAYVVNNQYYVEPTITSVFTSMGWSYDVVLSSNVSATNFSNYRLMVVGNGYFLNSAQIPVNNFPAVILNGENMQDWGWTKYISLTSQTSAFHGDITSLNNITSGFSLGDILLYTSASPDLYNMNENNIFSNVKIAVSMKSNPNNAVVAYANKGDILTKFGYPNTHVNAKTVFFGITESGYWTDESEQLFINSINWVLQKDSLNLNFISGANLVSFPIILSDNSVANLKLLYPQIISVKTYSAGNLVEAGVLENNKAYFILIDSNVSINFQGEKVILAQTINFNQGMNLVGFNKLTNMSLSSLPSQIKEVSRRNADGSYSIATRYTFGWNNPDSIVIEPGKGYWMKSSSQLNWSYSP